MSREKVGHSDKSFKPAGKPGSLGEDYSAQFRGYINLNLSDEQRATFDAWSTVNSLWEAFEYQVGDGVNISVKLDPKGEGFLASATQRRTSSPNAGLVVTARGREAATALGRVLYCLTILSHAERWEDLQPLANPDRW